MVSVKATGIVHASFLSYNPLQDSRPIYTHPGSEVQKHRMPALINQHFFQSYSHDRDQCIPGAVGFTESEKFLRCAEQHLMMSNGPLCLCAEYDEHDVLLILLPRSLNPWPTCEGSFF